MNSSTCSTRKSQKLGRQLRSGRISLKHKAKMRKKEQNQKFDITEELSLPTLSKGRTTQESENENSGLDEIISTSKSLQREYCTLKEKAFRENDEPENDGSHNRERENYAGQNNERENDNRENNERENDERENDERENDERENDERENDEHENDEHENDERENYAGQNNERENDELLDETIEYSDEDRGRQDISLDSVCDVSSVSDDNFFEKEKRTERLVVKVSGLEKRMNCIEKELKDLKKLLKYRAAKSPSILEYYENETDLTLLPKIPLLKVKRVYEMENSINTDKKFKQQLYKKLATIGGASVKDNLIRIFKRLFSAELRTKMCWNGTPDGKKKAFCSFTGILEVLLLAITYNFDYCTEEDIEQECKLRFKQAKKDFDREKEKLLKMQQHKLRQEREENEKGERRRKFRERQQL